MKSKAMRLIVGTAALAAGLARADVMTFTVNSTLSQLTLTPTTLLFGSPLPSSAQGAGSLVTGFSGTIVADITGSTIQFLGGSFLTALTSGDWLPGDDYNAGDYLTDPDAANYGVLTDLSSLSLPAASPSAVRDLTISLQHTAPVALTGGTFDEGGIVTDYTDGTVFYAVGGTPPVTDLTGVTPNPTLSTAAPATVTTIGEETTLTLPFQMTSQYLVNFLAVGQEYNGTIVATHVVPEPSTMAMLLLSLPLIRGIRRRLRAGTPPTGRA